MQYWGFCIKVVFGDDWSCYIVCVGDVFCLYGCWGSFFF